MRLAIEKFCNGPSSWSDIREHGDKSHGLGNDYVYVLPREERDWSALSIAVSERHTGIGSDGLILALPSDVADFRMRMFNADGSEAEMCGNGIRCVAKFALEEGLVRPGGAKI